MTSVKRITDLSDYTTVLPYDSELFGIYQPLLGWKSKRIEARFRQGFERDRTSMLEKLKNAFTGLVDIQSKDNGQIEIALKPGAPHAGALRSFDSILLQQVAARLPPYDKYKPDVWPTLITQDLLQAILQKEVTPVYATAYADLFKGGTLGGAAAPSLLRLDNRSDARRLQEAAFERQLQYESALAGALLFLEKKRRFDVLFDVFYATKDETARATELVRMLAAADSTQAYLDITNLDPQDKDDIGSVALSPISVVHLFRQYFFELDTFLGTPVSHVWLSPGSTVELLEIHTRKLTVEKTLENTLDVLTKSETATTDQDEISEAVKQDNDQDVKFGASVTASYGSISATSSFDLANSQKLARESSHKRMREQTQKLSSEIRTNFKSTFKTISEVTDISSTKHVMANTSEKLVNYELRRKMRQVGVQVQDIGTFLCWQCYVDDPGKELGLATLIHSAKSPDLDGIPHPEEIPALQPFQEERMVTIPFISVDGTNADNEGEVYADGVEVDDSEFLGSQERIQADFPQQFVCPKSDYELQNVEFDPGGKPVSVSRKGGIVNASGQASFTLHLDSADFQGQNSIEVKLVLHWSPLAAANAAIKQKNEEGLAAFKEQERAAYQKAFVETVKDRVTIASKIVARNADDLREEERIVVYRRLIQQMLLNGVDLPDDRTRHVVSEVLNSIFDVDKMLYFVAPEWWRPRLHRSRQQLQETPPQPIIDPPLGSALPATTKVLNKGLYKKVLTAGQASTQSALASSSVGWGGISDAERDNYYITDESEPARLGSSLGWLLQLDGDNMRNAFLNAPWVKAVIPIRPGKEEAAINWLKGVEGMNGITDDVIYHAASPDEKDSNGAPLDGQKMIDVLLDLAKKVQRKYEEGLTSGTYPKSDEVTDPALVDAENTVTATPIDRVYEHGFFPLAGGFRANVQKNYEIFDQWIEVLPTDQIVPVEVRYDPRSGRQSYDE